MSAHATSRLEDYLYGLLYVAVALDAIYANPVARFRLLSEKTKHEGHKESKPFFLTEAAVNAVFIHFGHK